jgi:dipeptidase E
MAFYNPRRWKYINVKGLGFIRGVYCPHYNSSTLGIPRRKYFRDMIRKLGGVGIAVENNCAIEFIDDKFFKVITSNSYSGAYRVYRSGGRVFAERIGQQKQLTPVHRLMNARRTNI